MSSHSARAQAPSLNQPVVVQEVVIYARHVVRRQVGVSPGTGARIEIVSLTRHIGFSDLDVTQESGAAELRNRISTAAKESCQQIETDYPSAVYPPDPPDQDCVKSATDGAMAIAAQVIAAAK